MSRVTVQSRSDDDPPYRTQKYRALIASVLVAFALASSICFCTTAPSRRVTSALALFHSSSEAASAALTSGTGQDTDSGGRLLSASTSALPAMIAAVTFRAMVAMLAAVDTPASTAEAMCCGKAAQAFTARATVAIDCASGWQ